MDIIAICALAIITAVICVMIKRYSPETSVMMSICACVMIFMVIASRMSSVLRHVDELFSSTGLPSEYLTVLFKTVGICFITEIAADTCRDAGESALAAKTEIAGKILILTIALPLFDEVITTAVTLIGQG